MHFKLPPFNFQLTPQQARRRGVLLILVGLFLISFIALITAVVLDIIPLSTFFPGVYRDPDAGPTPLPIAAFIFLGFFGLFGLLTVVQGIWQLAFGTNNRSLTIALLIMAGIFAVAGIISRGLR